MDSGGETSTAAAVVSILFRKSRIESLPNEKLTDRNEKETNDPDLLEKSVTGYQPGIHKRESLPKKPQHTASTKLNTCMDSKNEYFSKESEQCEPVHDESFRNTKKLSFMQFRTEKLFFETTGSIHKEVDLWRRISNSRSDEVM